MKLQFLGHSCFLLQFKNASVLVDPFFCDSANEAGFKRLVKAPCGARDLPKIDIILVSHEHFDHFDKSCIEHLVQRDHAFVVGHQSLIQELNCSQSFCRPIHMGQSIRLKGIDIEAREAHHPQAFYPLSYLIQGDKTKVYHAGDTALLDSFNSFKADVALFPIGGGDGTMDLIDAVKATKTMKPKYAIPMTYNTFEGIKADPQEFVQRIEKSIVPTKPVVLAPGETFRFK